MKLEANVKEEEEEKTNSHLSEKRMHITEKKFCLLAVDYFGVGAVKYVAIKTEPVSKLGLPPS
jgi:hypothetical protein